MTTIFIFGCLILLLLSGVPIFAALGLTATGILLVFEGHVGSVADTVFSNLDKSILATIPMFIFMAQVMMRAKVIDDLYGMANDLVGHVPGGLSVATVIACTIFAAISGSSVATAVSVGACSIPQMQRYGYSRRSALGVVAAGGTLGILIPPSGPMILYAIVSEASIGGLFLAGIIPGLLLALLFSIYAMTEASFGGGKRPPFAGLSRIAKAFVGSFWALAAPPVVLGGIYLGIFTASESAAIGALYALLIAVVIYRNFDWRALWDCTYATMRTSIMVFMIIAGAAMFGHAVTLIRLPNGITEIIAAAGLGRLSFLFVVMGMIFVMGMFFDSISIILITTPILLPTLHALHVDLIWYGVLLMVNLELAMITPPVGMNLFVIQGIANAPLSEVVFGAFPYVILMLLGLFLLLLAPIVVTWLPHLVGFGI